MSKTADVVISIQNDVIFLLERQNKVELSVESCQPIVDPAG